MAQGGEDHVITEKLYFYPDLSEADTADSIGESSTWARSRKSANGWAGRTSFNDIYVSNPPRARRIMM